MIASFGRGWNCISEPFYSRHGVFASRILQKSDFEEVGAHARIGPATNGKNMSSYVSNKGNRALWYRGTAPRIYHAGPCSLAIFSIRYPCAFTPIMLPFPRLNVCIASCLGILTYFTRKRKTASVPKGERTSNPQAGKRQSWRSRIVQTMLRFRSFLRQFTLLFFCCLRSRFAVFLAL